MKQQPKAPRLMLATNPSIPKWQGVTLEPEDALHRTADWVRVAASTRPGNIVLTGYTHIDAEGIASNAVIRVDLPDDYDADGINWVAQILDRIGVTTEQAASGRLGLVRGGLPS